MVFEEAIPDGEAAALQSNLQRCLDASNHPLGIFGKVGQNSGKFLLDGFFSPCYNFVGYPFPKSGFYTNGTFTFSLNGGFLADYRQCAQETAAYSNEIAQADAFVQTLTATNFATMTTNDVLGLYLYKDALPGLHAVQERFIGLVYSNTVSRTYCLPPRMGFRMLGYGPEGQDQYLWGLVPAKEPQTGDTLGVPIVYYNGKWWLSVWFLVPGEQTWQSVF